MKRVLILPRASTSSHSHDMSRTIATSRHFTFYRSKSLQQILSSPLQSTLRRLRALNAPAQLAPIPSDFFPKHVMFSSPLLPEAKLNAGDNSDKMTRRSPRPALSILTPCIPRKEVLQAHQWREPHSSYPTTLLNATHPGHFQSLFGN